MDGSVMHSAVCTEEALEVIPAMSEDRVVGSEEVLSI